MSDYLFGMVVWGETYVDEFLKLSLPSLLGAGNLDGRIIPTDSRFVILTRPEDWKRLEASPIFGVLQSRVAVEFWHLRDYAAYDKYQQVSRGQLEILCAAETAKYVMLVYPDFIWSENALKNTFGWLQHGAKAVFAPVPTIGSAAAQNLLARHPDEGGWSSTLPSRMIVETLLAHHHPMWDGFDWDKGCFTPSPACLKWTITSSIWLIRCLHLHPVALRVQPDNPLYFGEMSSLDGEYAPRLFDDLSEVHFATDSDDLALLSIRESDTPPLPEPGRQASVAGVAQWAERHAAIFSRLTLNIAFCWHSGTVDRAAWSDAVEESDAVIRQIQFRLNTPDTLLRYEDPQAYANRCDRAHDARRWRRPRILLPPSLRVKARNQLWIVTLKQVGHDLLWAAVVRVKHSWIGRRARRSPRLTRVWLQVKSTLRPTSILKRK